MAAMGSTTRLHTASAHGDASKVKQYIAAAGDPINCLDENEYTPLMRAVMNYRIKIVKILLRAVMCLQTHLEY